MKLGEVALGIGLVFGFWLLQSTWQALSAARTRFRRETGASAGSA